MKPEELHETTTQQEAAAAPAEAPLQPPSPPLPAAEQGDSPAAVAAAAEAVQPAAADVAEAGGAVGGVSRPSAAAPAQEPKQDQQDQRQAEAAPDQGLPQQPPGRLHWRRAERLQARELQAQHLLEHPFFAAIAGVRCPKQVCEVGHCAGLHVFYNETT